MLKKFPVSQELVNKLLLLTVDPALPPVDAWHKYFNLTPGPHSYLYFLMAAEEVLDAKDPFLTVSADFPAEFINKNGIKLLVAIFRFLLENFTPTLTYFFCFRYLFRSFSVLANSEAIAAARMREVLENSEKKKQAGHFGTLEEKDKLVSEVLNLVSMYQEANDPTALPLSDPEFNRHWCKVVRTGLEFLGNFAAADLSVLQMLKKDGRILSLLKNGIRSP